MPIYNEVRMPFIQNPRLHGLASFIDLEVMYASEIKSVLLAMLETLKSQIKSHPDLTTLSDEAFEEIVFFYSFDLASGNERADADFMKGIYSMRNLPSVSACVKLGECVRKALNGLISRSEAA